MPESKSRRITLAPLREGAVSVPIREVESLIPAGFRIGIAEGTVDHEERKVPIAVSAASNGSVCFVVDGRDYMFMIEDLVRAVLPWALEAKPDAADRE